MTSTAQQKPRDYPHPYLSGNFAPIHRVQPLTPCGYSGVIPAELAGGEYVRNGGNPLVNGELGRDAHWFDGDGMLSGVSFRRQDQGRHVEPEFVNQYVLTDVYLSSLATPALETPILPSIAILVNPLSSLFAITWRILRTLLLVALSHLPGSQQAIKRISVANTAVLYHDGRALATCESGPPMRISLPGLETVGWFNGRQNEGETALDGRPGFGGEGLLSFMKEWTTGHPRVDPKSSELLLYHSTFAPPYVHYSIVPATWTQRSEKAALPQIKLLNAPVSGVQSAKMMHDFGVSSNHTIILDLPLSLDPMKLLKNEPVVDYDPSGISRFGVFPRYRPDRVHWFETNPCCIFHTANSWDSKTEDSATGQQLSTVNMLACRLTSAALIFSAGCLATPIPTGPVPSYQQEEEQCRLYYYQFQLPSSTMAGCQAPTSEKKNFIRHQWALAAIPFEFPSLRESASMSAARYIYGCSVSGTTFGAALGRAVKIDSLVKVDVETLVRRGESCPPAQITGCVDCRSMEDIMASKDPNDPIQVFKTPPGWYAQESRFVPRANGESEDDGWLLSYVFDESQLGNDGECPLGAKSELWIIDAKNMTDVVARIYLPQRVPYGLHGHWFSEENVQGQRPIQSIRRLPLNQREDQSSFGWKVWIALRRGLESWLK